VADRSIKERLKSGEKILASWVYGLHPVNGEIMAIAGYPALLIDQEHGPVEIETIHLLMMAAQAHGSQAMVRVPSHDPNHVKRLLDLGVQTVMFPMVSSVAEAEAVVAACIYPPHGRRGLATGGIRASRYGTDKSYISTYRERQLIMVQIETLGGLEQVDAIAGTEGVDLIFVGPNDLAATMGFIGQRDHPKVREAIDHIVAVTKRRGKLLGTVPTEQRDAKSLFAAGFDLVISGSDVALLREAATAHYRAQRPGK
jgi:2-keto-3-deoxy-L-rhamnonate aldolase RhmA